MDVELIISGTPEGQDYYGPEESRQYMSTMYTTSADNKLMVEVRKEENGKVYCYNNYLVYKDVLGVGGRPGSYFCLSLRMDAYCTAIQSMYRLLDVAYHNYVKQALLKVAGNKVQYKAANFKDLTNEIESLQNFVYSNIQRSFSENDCVGLQGFQLSNGQNVQANLYDYPDQSLMACVQKGARLHVSPTFQTIQLQQLKEQYDKNWQADLKQFESVREADRVQRDKLNGDLSAAKQRISSLEATIMDLQAKNKAIETQLRAIGQAKEMEQLLESVKTPILKIADHIKAKAPVYAEEIHQRTSSTMGSLWSAIRKLIPFCNMCLLLVLLMLVLPQKGSLLPFSTPSSTADDETNQRMLATIDRLKQSNKELAEQVKRLQIRNVSIDVDGYNGKGFLQKKKSYQVQAQFGNTFKWEVEGAKWSNETSTMISITPQNEEDTVRIRLLMNKEPLVERSIPNP